MDNRRLSAVSTKSGVSTVVEAFLVDAPPQRRRTLRHVKKQAALRDSGLELSSSSSVPTSRGSDRRKQEESRGRPGPERATSAATVASLASHKARREVWKSGGIPVVVVPGRSSSVRSHSKGPSLRSTSSRRSRRSQSLSSAPAPQVSRGDYSLPERRPRHSRATTFESTGSRYGDQRTMDYPPTVPARSSSLSAPTSRNASRAGSLTAESLEAHNALQAQEARRALQALHSKQGSARAAETQGSESAPGQPPRPETAQRPTQQDQAAGRAATEPGQHLGPGRSDKDTRDYVPHHEGYDDPFGGRRLSVQKTPFSQVSVDTTVTSYAEVSEALAVNIYPHQNKSLLVVNHSNKPSESSSSNPSQTTPDQDSREARVAGPTAAQPATPPQPILSMDDVDSPLRNPQAPPDPPLIGFIPATPSGLTPAQEKGKLLGNYFEEMGQQLPPSASLLRRTFSRRRHSTYEPSPSRYPGFLTRTFSLSRNLGKRHAEALDVDVDGERIPTLAYSTTDDQPADESKLHPLWRPANSGPGEDEDDWDYDVRDDEPLRYPPIDNRPALGRSLSERVRRTFAILPSRDQYGDGYDPAEPDSTARRSIRRTSSGNLRVVGRQRSLDSIRRQARANDERPYTASSQGSRAWKSRLLRSSSYSKGHGDTESQLQAAEWPSFLAGFGAGLRALGAHSMPRKLSERRVEKRSGKLRLDISWPHEVRDGVGDVIKRNT